MRIYNIYPLLALFFLTISCGKRFLEKKRETNLVIPAKVSDYRAMVNDERLTASNWPYSMSIEGSDEFWVTKAAWETGFSISYREPGANAYIWNKDIYPIAEADLNWNYAYERIMMSNLILEIQKLTPTPQEQQDWNYTVGAASFFRGFSYYTLAQNYCLPYRKETADKDPGLPIRTNYDLEVVVNKRSSLQEVYDQAEKDLLLAATLLPTKRDHYYHTCRPAAHAALVRLYMQMDNYEKALHHINEAMKDNDFLINYNTLDFSFTDRVYGSPFPLWSFGNETVLYLAKSSGFWMINNRNFNADSTIVNSFDQYDIRRKLFEQTTDGRYIYLGSSVGNGHGSFNIGLSTEELWMNRAECFARQGEVDLAMKDLNHLLQHRYETGKFIPKVAGDKDAAMKIILMERRKELYMRGIRWEDVRRLNKEPEYQTTFVRVLENKRYELKPGSPRWAWPIPLQEIQTSGIDQNPR